MKPFTFAMLAAMAMFTVGCTQEQQLEEAQEDLAHEQAETAETMGEAQADGTVTPGEQEEITEQAGETAAAQGEVAEQTGEVIEKQADE